MCRKAGRLRPGATAARQSLLAGEARLVVIAADAGGDARERMRRLGARAGRPVVRFGTRAELGRATGLNDLSVLSITDERMAGALMAALAGVDG